MQWYEITMNARDVLFFRGAKPMEASAIGEGVNWPVPSVFHQALLSAFHRKWPKHQANWEQEHRLNKERDSNEKSSFRFGALQTIGIFPRTKEGLYLPTPSDIQYLNNEGRELCLLQPQELKGRGDLPKPLTKALIKPGEASKKHPSRWIPLKTFQSYLSGNLNEFNEAELYHTEYRPGIEVNAEHNTVEEGQFYLAEYMRLRDDVSLSGFAACQQSRYAGEGITDIVDLFIKDTDAIIMGGQQGFLHLSGEKVNPFHCSFKEPQDSACRFIKWILLSPAVFTGGWLPSWVNRENGEVVQYGKPPRQNGESRIQWRKRISENTTQEVLGRLVAACVPKPFVYSGWRSYGGNGNTGVKPSRLCVPAGAIYYFEVSENSNAKNLISFLHGECKSDISAEKGFGFGVCGTWNPED